MKEMSLSGLFVGGTHLKGQSVRDKHERSLQSVSQSICTSYGPLGMDKMCIDHTGEVTCTNDGATILKAMDLQEPAAKMMVDLAKQQDHEIGDGTTSVVLLAASLVEKGNLIIKRGVHPSSLIAGFKLAFKESVNFLKDLQVEASKLNGSVLKNVAETTIASKIIKTESETFSKIVVEALKNIEEDGIYDLKLINILKLQGESMKDSIFISGFALNCSVASNLMIKSFKVPKIVCLNFSLQKTKLPLGIAVVVENPDALEEIRKKETSITRERVQKIIKSGANVILTSGGIDDSCIKQFLDANCMAVRRVKEEDLNVIANAIGTNVLNSLSDLDGDDIEPHLGVAESVSVKELGEKDCIFIKGLRKKMSSIILRGANEQVLDEMHRSVHDALSSVKQVLQSKMVLPGGGAVEIALSVHLDHFANTICSKDQLGVQKYSEALLCIPRALAVNSGLDSNEIVAKILSQHMRSKEPSRFRIGMNCVTGTIQDNFKAGIIEPAISKLKALRAATEVAISILRVDEIIEVEGEDN